MNALRVVKGENGYQMGNQNKTKIPLASSWFEEFSNTPCSVNTFFISFLKNSIQRASSGSNSSL